MASNYKILSAFSDSGANLYIPIEWDFDKVSDLSVIIVDDTGNAKRIDYWTWNSALKQVEINNTQGYKYWAGYVMREEDSATVLQAVASMEVNAQNIIEQFKKTNRIIEQIQETSKTTLRSPDYIEGILPNATKRAKRFLSFDENGNPVCEVGVDEFDDAKNSTNLAMQEAQNAQRNAETAQTEAENAKTGAENAKTGAEEAYANTQNIANNAIENIETAKTGAVNEIESKVEEAKGYAESASESAKSASATLSSVVKKDELTGLLPEATVSNKGIVQLANYADINNIYFKKDMYYDGVDNTKAVTPYVLASAFAEKKIHGDEYLNEENDYRYLTPSSLKNYISHRTSVSGANAIDPTNTYSIITAKSLSDAFLEKQDLLYFGNGSIATANKITIPVANGFSICRTFRITSEEWSAMENINFDGTYTDTTSYTSEGFYFRKSSNILAFNLKTPAGARRPTSVNNFPVYYVDGDVHTLCCCYSHADRKVHFYVDGVEKAKTSSAFNVSDITAPSDVFKIGGIPSGYWGRIYNFSFDMSAEGSPYTIFDYHKGKPIPASVYANNQVVLALEDYTIGGKVLDYSGNKNHATITGSVAGGNDARIEAFVETITTLTSEQN